MSVIEGNSREVEIMLDHATETHFTVMVMTNPLTATGKADKYFSQKSLTIK